jgi:hypothetical protein
MTGILGITSSGVDTTTTVDTLDANDVIMPSITVSEPQLIENTLDLDIAVIRATVTTGSGTQDFTSTSFGTAKGAWFIASTDQSDSQTTNSGSGTWLGFSVGFTDGTNEGIIGYQVGDNQTTLQVNSIQRDDSCAGVFEYSTEQGEDFLSFDSFITDGVRLLKTGISRAFLLTIVLFKGSDFEIAVGKTDADSTVSGLSFKPNVVLGLTRGGNLLNSPSTHAWGSTGFAHDTGAGTVEHCASSLGNDNTNPSETSSEFKTDKYVMRGPGTWEASITSWNSDGFATSTGGSETADVVYAAMRFGGGVSLSYEVTPTATGANSKTGLSFQPGFLMTICSDDTATDTHRFNGIGLAKHVSVTDGTNEYIHCWGFEDGVTPQTTWTAAGQATALCYNDSGSTKQYEATLTSFNADGWTENFTTAPGTAQYTIRFAVEA